MIDPATLDRMIRLLPPDLGAELSRWAEPLWRQRQRRLAARDDAIRRALILLSDAPNPPARLAELMTQRVGQRHGMTGNHLIAEAVGAVLALNDGAPLRERQVRNIATGERAPVQ